MAPTFTTLADYTLDGLFGFASANAIKNNVQYLKENLIDSGFPSGIKMAFYADTAPAGWTIDTTVDDVVSYVSKGSVAGGRTGGTTSAAANATATGSLSTVSISSSITPTYGNSITTDPGASNRLCPYTSAGGISTVSNLGSSTTSTINASYIPKSANFILCTKAAYP